MPKVDAMSKAELLRSISLKGKVIQSEGDSVTLHTDGALLTINKSDIRATKELGGDERELRVAADAKIVFETLLTPAEAGGILSKEAVVQIVGSGLRASGECECSRCTGGECECSRCVDARFGNSIRGELGGFRRILAK